MASGAFAAGAAVITAATGAALAVAAGLDGALALAAFSGIGMFGAMMDFVAGVASTAIIVCLMWLLRRGAPAGAAATSTSPCCRPVWHYVGGLCGATYVACAVLGSPLGGFSVLFAAAVAGQLVAGAVLDHLCGIGGERSRVDCWKVCALSVTVAGAVLSAVGALISGGGASAGGTALGACLGLIGGVAIAVQTTANTRLAARMGSSVLASLVSLSIGAVATFLVCVVVTLTMPRGPGPTLEGLTPSAAPWWMWIGGLGSTMAVIAGAELPPFIGVSGFSVALVAGQLAMSLILDATGTLGGAGAVGGLRVVGVVLVFLGATAAQFANPFGSGSSAHKVSAPPSPTAGPGVVLAKAEDENHDPAPVASP